MGVNGCGGHEALSMGATTAEVVSHLSETWVDLTPGNWAIGSAT